MEKSDTAWGQRPWGLTAWDGSGFCQLKVCALGKLLNGSVPQFLHLQNGDDNNRTYRVIQRLNEQMYIKYSENCRHILSTQKGWVSYSAAAEAAAASALMVLSKGPKDSQRYNFQTQVHKRSLEEVLGYCWRLRGGLRVMVLNKLKLS